MKIKSLFILPALVLNIPAQAREPAPTGLEQFTRTLAAKGVITDTDTVAILRLAGLEQPPAPAVSLPEGMKVKVAGLGRVRYTYTDGAPGKTDTSYWKLRTARLTFSGQITPDFSYMAQGALEKAGGSTSTVDSTLLDASLSYSPAEQFSLTVGQFKVPVGAEAYQATDINLTWRT